MSASREKRAADRHALAIPACPRCGDITAAAFCRCGEPMTELAAARARRAKAIRETLEHDWQAA